MNPTLQDGPMLAGTLHTIHVDGGAGIARVRLAGDITGTDVLEALKELLEHPDWRPGFSTLWDARGVRSIDVRPEDVEALASDAKRIAARRGPGRSAIVTTDQSIRLAGALLAVKTKVGPEREFLIFSHVELAERWLAQEG